MSGKNGFDKLFKLMEEHPKLNVIFFYPDYGADGYTAAKVDRILIDEIVFYEPYDDERILFKSEDFESIVDYFASEESILGPFEENFRPEEINETAIRRANALPWKKAIIVFLEPADI